MSEPSRDHGYYRNLCAGFLIDLHANLFQLRAVSLSTCAKVVYVPGRLQLRKWFCASEQKGNTDENRDYSQLFPTLHWPIIVQERDASHFVGAARATNLNYGLRPTSRLLYSRITRYAHNQLDDRHPRLALASQGYQGQGAVPFAGQMEQRIYHGR
jgi:hypothetical protein